MLGLIGNKIFGLNIPDDLLGFIGGFLFAWAVFLMALEYRKKKGNGQQGNDEVYICRKYTGSKNKKVTTSEEVAGEMVPKKAIKHFIRVVQRVVLKISEWKKKVRHLL